MRSALHDDSDSEPLYTELYKLRWPRNPKEYKLEMSVDVERVRLEISFSQPVPSPECDSSPRRSPAIGTGSDEPRVPRAETQQSTEQAILFPLQASVDGFLHVDCTRNLDQEGTELLQADVGVKPETTTTKAQVTAREELRESRLADNREERHRPSKASSLTWGGDE